MNDDRVFLLFEGVCPNCGADVHVTQVGGTEEFFRDHPFTGYPKVVWTKGVTEIGEVDFTCKRGHKNSAFLLEGGDWA